jgi:hypothetical protein
MVDFVKVKGQEINLTTANTVGAAVLVRVFAPANTVLTFANTTATYGTYSMAAGMDEVFIKEPTDTVAASVSAKCVAIAYK